MRTALLAVLGLVALGGVVVEADVCTRACLAPYQTATPTAQRTAKDACRRACLAMTQQRQTCLKVTNGFWRNETKVCRRSLQGIKLGRPPLATTFTVTTTYNGTAVNTTFTYQYDSTCLKEIKADWADTQLTCKELLCPANQYWSLAAFGCVSNPNQLLPTVGSGAVPPAIMRGFYKFSWLASDPYQGPSDTNTGVTFTGRIPPDPEANIAPLTRDALNLLSYGGGNQFGLWTPTNVALVGSSANLDQVIALGYDGIVIDAEESYTAISVADWNAMFAAVKAKNLLLVVTISHFSPYGMANAQALVADWLQNPNIDYLSPQLYTSGTEAQNDWAGFNPAFKTASVKIAPSIVQASYYDQLGANSVTAWLPNAAGYFVWSNTPVPTPGPTDCVTGQFSGVGCYYMCDWCRTQLGTSNFYWTGNPPVCAFDATLGYCNGNPFAGVQYTCCKVGSSP